MVGHIQPNLAVDPGHVYDLNVTDYLNYLCGCKYTSEQLKVFYGKPYTCPESFSGENFNYPTITMYMKVYYVPWRPFFNQNTFPTLYGILPIVRTILIRERINIVHGHQTFSTLSHEALMHARIMGYKVVCTDHSLNGFSDSGSIHMNKVLQFTLANVSQAIFVSHTSKENTVLRCGLVSEKVFVIPNDVDTIVFKPAFEHPSQLEIVIVVISRLVYREGADLLVEVIPKVCRLNPNVS